MVLYATQITNSIGILGGGPANRWGVMYWHQNEWGFSSENIPLGIKPLITNSVGGTTSMPAAKVQLGVAETLLPSPAIALGTRFSISDSMPLNASYALDVRDLAGYTYIFPGNTTNPWLQDSTVMNSQAAGIDAWASAAAISGVTIPSWSSQ